MPIKVEHDTYGFIFIKLETSPVVEITLTTEQAAELAQLLEDHLADAEMDQ